MTVPGLSGTSRLPAVRWGRVVGSGAGTVSRCDSSHVEHPELCITRGSPCQPWSLNDCVQHRVPPLLPACPGRSLCWFTCLWPACLLLLSLSDLRDVDLVRALLCAKNLAKKDFFRLPDPFAKIVVDGSGQCHSTDTVKNTLDPKWNQHYDLTVYEDSGPGRPLSCFMEEPAPYTDGTGAAAGGGSCRFVESPSQDQRLQAQRLRNPEVRGSLQTPQNRPHGHQSPELPEGYGHSRDLGMTLAPTPSVPGLLCPQSTRSPSHRQWTHQCQLKEPSQPLPLPSEGSVEDEELPAQRYERDLVQKLKVLRHELSLQQPQAGHCRIEVSREEIFEESYRQIMKMRPKDLKKRLMVKFRGEEGLDYGGVASPSHPHVCAVRGPQPQETRCDHLSYFHFVGRIMGLAVFHGHYINGGFTVPFYKQLLGKPIQLSDLESVDPELHKSLVWILENDITPVLDHTFCVEHNAFGRILQHELKPNGRNVPVTEENKKEYVRLYVNWRFMRGIEAQFLALQKGFNELIPQHLLKPFDQKELELIIGGLDKIDLDDWKSNTRLKHCGADSNVVRWFWQAVETFDEERRARLLQFVTGSTRVPLQGFKALQGSTGAAGPRLFTIHLIDANTDNLPKAHTCFNRIDIPPYESYEKLYEKLLTAVEETCGFAVE
ncbi:E3 ubiquitin-protein ligase SMURF1 isoform 2 [Camelus ferus]|nr:E3 ubiquitin-protein ligase SMURF1 isoform 2 [Camelus ferus]